MPRAEWRPPGPTVPEHRQPGCDHHDGAVRRTAPPAAAATVAGSPDPRTGGSRPAFFSVIPRLSHATLLFNFLIAAMVAASAEAQCLAIIKAV